MEEILRLFPKKFKTEITQKVGERWFHLEEIRLRVDRPIELNFSNRTEWLTQHIFLRQDSYYILNQLSEHSLYRMEDQLQQGYMTIEGGHRVGLAGEVVTEKGRVQHLKHITFFNIRVAKQFINIAKPLIPYLHDGHDVFNTLIVGPPQTGKTTLIRDIARIFSDGIMLHHKKKVGIIDERSEIAASIDGIPQHQIGTRTDVLDACPKVDGMMMMIRSMSPELLIVDEIGKKDDATALIEAIYAGVAIICTIHARSFEELQRKDVLHPLLNNEVFRRIVILNKSPLNSYEFTVFNATGKQISHSSVVKR